MSLRSVGAVKDTTVVTVYDPRTGIALLNADGSEMTVTLHGPYSARYKSTMREQQQQRIEQMGRGAMRATMTPEETEAAMDELLLACIEDWSLTLEGDERLPYSREAARDVLKEFPWLRDQLNIALGNVAGFLEPHKPH